MNPYAIIGSALLIVAVITGAYFEGRSAGMAICTARDQGNTLVAVAQQRTDWLVQDKKDEQLGFKLGADLDLTTSTTTDLSEAIHAPIPAPAAATRLIPNPFPPGFSLCWNAASSRDPAAVAACETR